MKEKTTQLDYSKLKKKIVEKYGSLCRFAEVLGLSKSTLSRRFNESSFLLSEVRAIKRLLDIPDSEAMSYFFTFKTN